VARAWKYALIAIFASAPVYFERWPGVLSAPILGLATLVVPYLIAIWRLGHRRTLRILLVGGSAVLAMFSVVTGYVNTLTDEWNTPQYVSLLFQGHDWYSVPLQFQYVFPGRLVRESTFNVYLPLLPFIQAPYVWLDYRWFTLAVWGLIVFAVRKRYYTSIALGGQYPAVMAANGFNDVIPLLFLTLAFVTFSGRRARTAQILSLGMKQFANAFVFVYHILRRDWRQAGITMVASILFLLPFLIWDWKSAICSPVLDMPPSCQNAQNLAFNSVHSDINFALWPVWIIAVFYPAILAWIARLNQELGKVRTSRARFFGREVLGRPASSGINVSESHPAKHESIY
jgi:hypothetical protein